MGQVLELPDGHGMAQDSFASTMFSPQKNDSGLEQGVYAKHWSMPGQSALARLGQGSEHLSEASS